MKNLPRPHLVAAAVLAALVLGAPAEAAEDSSCGPIQFQTAATYPALQRMAGMLAGDFNGDGLPDLLVWGGPGEPGFGVLLGKPDGTLDAPIMTPSAGADTIVAGYFDADANLDLVVGDSQAAFFAGNGDGTFKAPVPVDTGGADRPIAADLDGDGKPDLVAVTMGGVKVMLGNGDGTFGSPAFFPAGLNPYPSTAAAGDVNHDGKPDLLVSGYNPPNGVAVLLNDGSGGFQAPIPIAWDGVVYQMKVVDVDADGNPDVVGADGSVLVFPGDGTGHFAAPAQYSLPPGLLATGLVVVDFDGDGFPDVGVATSGYPPSTGYVVLFRNAGDGSLLMDRAYVGGQPVLVAADFGSDGAVDLAFPTAGNTSISVLYGRGSTTFAGSPASAFDLPYTYAMALGDFNEDGFADAAIGTYGDFSNGTDLFVLTGVGDGRFSPANSSAYSQRLVSVETADFNEDGHLDLLVGGEQSALFVLLGQGNGTFGNQIGLPVNGGALPGPAITRFGPQSHLDLVVLSGDFNGPQTWSLIGNGDGTFSSGPIEALPTYVTGMAAGDFDGDGFADLALSLNDGSLRIRLGTGDGHFGSERAYDAGPFGQLVAADVDGDGKIDVLATGDGTIAIFYGNGDGTFVQATIGLGWTAQALALADFDLDGHMDIVSANGDAGNVALLRGLGGRRFESPAAFPAGVAAQLIAAGDVDGSGSPGVVVATQPGLVSLLTARRAVSVSDASAVVGSAALLSANASGFGPLTYQWRKGGVPLSDGGAISGSHTGTLTIDPVSFDDAGSYDLLVTDACGSTGSNSATLSVEFADVPVSSPFHADILTVATAGITAGCGGGNYCPASPVRRDQMAVFLLKSEHGSGYVPPDCAGTFPDVACPGPFTNWIEQLAAEGVTSGCGGGNYCPDSSVTRAQMAVFLLKTSLGSGYAPPAATGIFGDVPVGAFAADFIEDLYNRAISGGCSASPLLYCPNNPVLRQQMATFLVRTFAP